MYGMLFKDNTKKIIENLLEGSKSLTELSELMDLSKPGLQQKYLGSLKDLGIVEKKLEKTERGREAYYFLQRFSLFLVIEPENKSGISIVTSSKFRLSLLLTEQITNGEFKDDLNLLMEKIVQMNDKEKPEYVILFGSVARGEGIWKSDIDIAILRFQWDKRTKQDYLNLISEITMNTKHQIKPQFFTLSEFEHNDNLLIKEVKESGIVMFGDIFGGKDLWKEMKQYRNITILAKNS